MTTTFSSLIEAIRMYQKLNMFVSLAYQTELSLLEGHILVELEIGRYTTPKALAAALNVRPMSISRALMVLTHAKLIGRITSKGDRRSITLELLPKASSVMMRYEQGAEHSIARLMRVLSRDEVAQLRQGLFEFTEAFGIARPEERRNEHPLRAPIRGVTRALELLELRPTYSSLTALEWHILSELKGASRLVTVEELLEELPIDYHRLSYTLNNLAKRRLTIRVSHKSDKRLYYYEQERKGNLALDGMMAELHHRAKNALEHIPKKHIAITGELLWKVVNAHCSPNLSTASMVILTEADQYSEARALFAREWLRIAKNQNLFPEILFAEQNSCKGVYLGRTLVAAIEEINGANVPIRKVISSKIPATMASQIRHLIEESP